MTASAAAAGSGERLAREPEFADDWDRMPRLAARTRAHARDLVESMRSFDPDGPSALSWITPEIPKLLRSEKINVSTFRQRGHRIALGSYHAAGLAEDGDRLFEDWFEDWLARQPPVGWTSYNPVRPEPRQRNRVFDLSSLERLVGGSRFTYPIIEVLAKWGTAGDEQLRVLVCDRSSLLAYVCAFQRDVFTVHQKTALAAIVPALQKRLTFERLASHGERQAAALDAALESIGRPAFVTSARGTIHEVNASARELLARAGADVRRALVDAIARRPSRYAFDLTPLRIAGGGACYLAVLRDSATEHLHATCAAVAAARWGLTPRRREVLMMVVRGMANATIAAELGISERAVEGHVSAIFDRAGVDNRAALVALVMQAVT